jgi:hypothetical protein
MTVIPETKEPTDKPTPMTIMVPNKDGARGLAPPDSVEALSGQLRVGDKLSLTYQKSGLRRSFRKASPDGGGSNAADRVFTFVRSQSVRLGRKRHDAVVASLGPVTCVFLIADAEAKDAFDGPPAPAPDLRTKIKACLPGARMRLKYEPHNFFFWLQDVEAVKSDDATAKAD